MMSIFRVIAFVSVFVVGTGWLTAVMMLALSRFLGQDTSWWRR